MRQLEQRPYGGTMSGILEEKQEGKIKKMQEEKQVWLKQSEQGGRW